MFHYWVLTNCKICTWSCSNINNMFFPFGTDSHVFSWCLYWFSGIFTLFVCVLLCTQYVMNCFIVIPCMFFFRICVYLFISMSMIYCELFFNQLLECSCLCMSGWVLARWSLSWHTSSYFCWLSCTSFCNLSILGGFCFTIWAFHSCPHSDTTSFDNQE